MSCIHRLGEALSQLAGRPIPSSLRYDKDNRLRVITYPADFRDVVDASFHQIRQYGSSSVAVLICLLETLRGVATFAGREADRAALAHHAELVHRSACRNLQEEADLADVKKHFDAVQLALRLQESIVEPSKCRKV